MSGRVVKIEILGEGASGAKAFASVDSAAGKTEGVLGKLGGGIGKVGSAFGSMAKIAGGFVLAQGILAAPGALLNMAKAAADDSASMGRLQQAVENAGGSWDSLKGTYEGVIKSGQDLAFSDDDIRDGMVNLLNATGDTDEAMRRMSAAQDLARGTGMDLGTATKLLGKASDENVGILKRYGITLGENATAQDLMNEVDKRFGGQAAKFAESDAGKIARLTDRWGELQETIGYMVLPVLSTVVDLLLDKVIPALETATTSLGGFVTKAGELAGAFRGRLTKAFETLQPYMDTFLTVAKDLQIVLAGPLAAAIIGMIKGFGEEGLAGVLPGAAEGLQRFVDALGELATLALGAIQSTDWSAVAGAIVDGIVVGITAVTDFGTRFATWASGQFAAVDWSATGVAMLAGIALGWTTVTDFGTRFVAWMATTFEGVAWDAVGAAIVTGIFAGLTTVTDFGTRVVSWIAGQFAAIGAEVWTPTGESILLGIGAALLSLTGWGAAIVIVTKIAIWLQDAAGEVDWSGTATAILDQLAAGWETVTDFGTRFVTWLQEQYAAADWSGVATTIQTGISDALAALSGGEGGDSFLQPLIDEIAGLAGKLTPAFEAIKTATTTFVENLKPSYTDLKLAIDQLAIAWDNVKQAYQDTAEELGSHDWEPEKEALVTLATVGLGGVILAARGLSLAILGLAIVLRGLSELNNVTVVPSIKVVELALDLLSTQVNDTWTVVSTAWNIASGIPGTIKTGAEAIKTAIETMLQAVQTAWDSTWGAISTTVESAWNGAGGIVGTVSGGIGEVKGAISGVLGEITGIWEGAWGGMAGFVDGIMTRVKNAVNSVVGGINSFIGGVNSALSFSVPGFHFDTHIPGVGVVGYDGFSVSGPNIPSVPYPFGGGSSAQSNTLVNPLANIGTNVPINVGTNVGGFDPGQLTPGTGGGSNLQQLAAAQQAALNRLTVAGQQLQAAIATGDPTYIAQAQYRYQQAILDYQQAQAAYQAGVMAPPGNVGTGVPPFDPGGLVPQPGPSAQEQAQGFYDALHNIQGGGVGAPAMFGKGGQSAGGFVFAGGSTGGPTGSVPAGSVGVAAYLIISLADFVKQVLDPSVAPLMLQLGVHAGGGVP